MAQPRFVNKFQAAKVMAKKRACAAKLRMINRTKVMVKSKIMQILKTPIK
jgi:hypothetical protein